jgi:penicillin-binding protein A
LAPRAQGEYSDTSMRTLVGWHLALTAALLGSVFVRDVGAKGSNSLALSTIRFHGTQAVAMDSLGKTRVLGLDSELQSATRKVLLDARAVSGAAVLLEVETGQVLAAVEVGVTSSGQLLLTPSAPSASVFKIVTTAALYERGGVNPRDRICTRGGLRGIREEHLAPAVGPGTVCSPFQEALAVSRNAAYAQLSTGRLLRTDLLEVAESFGFNRSLSLDVRGQLGLLDVPFNDLEFARTAAGFQNSRLSVFGGAQLALTVASGGAPRGMHLERSVEPIAPGDRVISETTAARIRRSMELAVQSGTARDAFLDEHGRNYLGYIQVAGKTGTLKPRGHDVTSSWFIGFAPSQKPTVVLALLLQIQDKWHKKAATSGRDLLRYYFARRGARNVTPPFELTTGPQETPTTAAPDRTPPAQTPSDQRADLAPDGTPTAKPHNQSGEREGQP